MDGTQQKHKVRNIRKASKTRRIRSLPKTNGTRRTCETEGCITVLSRYNLEDLCMIHQPKRKPRIRGLRDDST